MPSFATHKKSISPSKSTHNHYIFIVYIIRHLLRHPLKFLVLFAALFATMSSAAWDNHLPLRRAVGRLLLDANVSQNTTTSFEQLADPLCILAGVVRPQDDIALVDHDLLVSAFSRCADEKEYIITYKDLGINSQEIRKFLYNDSHSDEDHLLLVRSGVAQGRKGARGDRIYEVCHLVNSDKEQRRMRRDNSTEHTAIGYTGKGDYEQLFVPPLGANSSNHVPHPLKPPYMATNNFTNKKKIQLQLYLTERKSQTKLNQSSKANQSNTITPKVVKTGNKRKGANQNRSAGGRFGGKKEAVEESKDTTTNNDGSKSPSQKRGRKQSAKSSSITTDMDMLNRLEEVGINDRKKRIKELQKQLQKEILDTQKKIVELGIAMSEKVQQGIQVQSEYEKLKKEEQQQQQQQPPVNNNNSSDNSNKSNDEDVTMEEADEAAWDFNKYNEKKAAPITYTLPSGKVGEIEEIKKGFIFINELYNNLIDVPEGTDNPQGDKTRAGKKTKIGVNGASQHFIPVHTTLIQTDKLNMYLKSHEVVKKLKNVFSGKQSSFSDESRAIMAAYNVTGYGCSDEATSMIQCGAWLALLNEIDVDITDEQVANACPSARSLARWELMLATDCMGMNIEEMKRDMEGREFRYCGVITDHGHRGNQDHFVIVVVWAGYDEYGNKTLKFFCPSIDQCGHTAAAAANGVKNILDRALVGINVEAKVITGDAGGGGAVQHLYKKLVDMGIMDETCKETNCSLHGLQKAIENASKKIMGDQGMGCRSPFQMLYLFSRLTSTLKKDGGLRHLDMMWSKVSEELETNEEWQELADDKMKQAWREFVSTVEAVQLEDGNEEGVGNLEKRLSKAPRDIQDPVWTRWASVSKCPLLN